MTVDLEIWQEIIRYGRYNTYKKGEFLPFFQNKKQEILFLQKGKVSLMKSDVHGNLLYIDHFSEHDFFSNMWIYNEENDLFFVCNSDVEVYFVDYTFFTQNSSSKYLVYLLDKCISYTYLLNQKISILQKKNMEDKLLSYFRSLASLNEKRRFEIPLTYKELADYLGVDRSSLMRKLKDLENEKKIKRKGKTIFLANGV